MITDIIGALANLTSLILWIPQAKTTWKNRNDPQALEGVSIGTQILVAINTILWCIYGVMIKNVWLPLGTIIILPLASLSIFLKKKSGKNKKITVDVEKETWFTFADFRRLDPENKELCLKAIYTTDFGQQVSAGMLNWESYEEMNELDQMFWNKELWIEKYCV
ncbi:SemiSWEET family sugar transporter [Enterococcus wangshanyuanii]|uniref:Uncharacterized protein n=1 Tax=Enterococcus wangshanyuanii TaxID=2005703 RepID=A0ABQ1PD13_9ENTE|nr:hypothetical protein [Enterococcus wangshanyuanii]GGC94856.1 hypothetical protein GCM10011573_25620 [Enterococcus wangshanyuanii]